jgi:GntR family transcriptional repressor for pyruvate dehydrogenase complex
MQHDYAFHRLVAEAAANRYLLEAVDRLGPQMIAMPRGRLAAHHTAARFATVVQEHQAVLDALTAKDPLAAAAAMRVHLAASRRRLLAETGQAR